LRAFAVAVGSFAVDELRVEELFEEFVGEGFGDLGLDLLVVFGI
jgi:hypothetical protein